LKGKIEKEIASYASSDHFIVDTVTGTYWKGTMELKKLKWSVAVVFFLTLLSEPVFALDLLISESYWPDESLKKQYTYYLENGTKIYHGTYTRWREDGIISSQSEYEHGSEVKSNIWEFFPDTTQPFKYTAAEVIQGVRYVTVIDYFQNGCKSKEEHQVDGVRTGTSTQWHSCDNIAIQYDLIDGLLHGWRRSWDESGNIITEEQRKYGKLHGQWKVYKQHSDSGSGTPGTYLILQKTYNNGILHGPCKYFYAGMGYSQDGLNSPEWAEGLLARTGQYGNGKKCGIWTYSLLDDANQTLSGETYTNDLGSCESLNVPEPDPFPEIVKDDPLVQKEVRGQVSDRKTGSPIASATITAEGGVSTESDSKGNYSFTLGTGDTYKISVSKEGYYTRSGTIKLGSTQYKRLNVKLKKAEAKPAITHVESRYGNFFLEGIPVHNTYTVSVDWNGEEPGSVKFAVNGKVSEVAAAGDNVTQSFNMGSEFKAGFGNHTNTLQIRAVTKGGTRSDIERCHPVVVPVPGWSTALGSFGSFKNENGILTYTLENAWPEEPLEIQVNEKSLGALWSAWNLFPLVGGQNFGIPPTQAFLDIEAKTDGSGSVSSGGKTGFQAAGQEIEGKLGGKGSLQYKSGKGLEWQGASLLMGVEGTLKKEVGPVTLIPALENAVNLGFGVGRMIAWFNNLAKIEGSIKAGADIDLKIIGKDGKIKFQEAEGVLNNGIELGLSLEAGKIKAQISGGGTNKAYWQFPASPGYLKKVEAELSAKIALAIWLFSKDFEAKHTFTSSATAAGAPTALAVTPMESSAFKPMSRDFLDNDDYNLFTADDNATRSPMGLRMPLDSTANPYPLVENVFPQSEPAIAHNNGKTGIAYIYFDPADTTLQATEIYFSFNDGTGYTTPSAIKNDTRAEFSPSIAFDGQGNVVAVWERVKETDFAGTEINEMAAAMEIVYAVYDSTPGQWTEPVSLTDNAYLDHSPMLQRAADGSILLVWKSNPGNLLIGDAVMPTSMHYALWNGNNFSTIGLLPGTFENSIKFSLAYQDSRAILSYMKDMDGDLTTTLDEEIFYNTFDGTVWSTAVRITDDQVADVNPKVVFRSDGTRELVWLRDNALVRMTDWAAGTYEVIRTGSASITFSDFKLTIDQNNRLLVLWQGIDQKGIDIFYSVYDAENHVWSNDLRLTLDPDMERDMAVVFSSDNTLHMVYNKENMETHVVALYHLTYQLAADAAIFTEGLALDPADPDPGTDVILTCRVENVGDTALKNIFVEFYLGDPATDGTLINRVALAPDLVKAGESGTATLSWTIPQDIETYTVYAKAVPESAVTEANLSNNTAFLQVMKPDIKAVQCIMEERENGSVDITAIIQNRGHVASPPVKILYTAGGTDLGVIEIPGLLPLKRAEITHNIWLDTAILAWKMDFQIIADPLDTIAESSENNNMAATFFVPQGVTPIAHDFNHVDEGTASAAQTFTFTNTINADIRIGTLFNSGDDSPDFLLQKDTCTDSTLATGETCTIDVVFSPSTRGLKTAFLTITSGNPGEEDGILTEIPLYGGLQIQKGDVDGSGGVSLSDALIVLKQLSQDKSARAYSNADINADKKIGIVEAEAILQQASGLRAQVVQ